MKFFVPGLADPDEAERFYFILRTLAAGRHGPLSPRRIASISFSRGGHDHAASVGGDDTLSGLPCVVIFEARSGGLYFVYTEGPVARTGVMVTSPYHVEAFDEA